MSHRHRGVDVNAVVAGYLRDLAFAQSSPQKTFGYKRAAAAILGLDTLLTDLVGPGGELPRIPGIGPASTRVISEVLASGESPTVEQAVAGSARRADIERRRRLRDNFLSRAEANRIIAGASYREPTRHQYGGDFQMHSEWSDGVPSVAELADACIARGYRFAAVTDHSYGLAIARGMSMAAATAQREAIDAVNASRDGFHLLQGIEANIGVDGELDLSEEEAATFDIVLAAPHSRLRRPEDQTPRLLAAVAHDAVRILAHPRGRIAGSRAGIVADWDAVFAEAARQGVAVEIDGDPSRQDLDHVLARRALACGCVFALDSDAHATSQLWYADIALAHARLAGIPADRIVNCWPLEQVRAWLADRKSARSRA